MNSIIDEIESYNLISGVVWRTADCFVAGVCAFMFGIDWFENKSNKRLQITRKSNG